MYKENNSCPLFISIGEGVAEGLLDMNPLDLQSTKIVLTGVLWFLSYYLTTVSDQPVSWGAGSRGHNNNNSTVAVIIIIIQNIHFRVESDTESVSQPDCPKKGLQIQYANDALECFHREGNHL